MVILFQNPFFSPQGMKPQSCREREDMRRREHLGLMWEKQCLCLGWAALSSKIQMWWIPSPSTAKSPVLHGEMVAKQTWFKWKKNLIPLAKFIMWVRWSHKGYSGNHGLNKILKKWSKTHVKTTFFFFLYESLLCTGKKKKKTNQ